MTAQLKFHLLLESGCGLSNGCYTNTTHVLHATPYAPAIKRVIINLQARLIADCSPGILWTPYEVTAKEYVNVTKAINIDS